MLLRPKTAGSVAGTGTIQLEGRILGGVLLSTNNTNAAAVVIRSNDASGAVVFQLSSLSPGFFVAPVDVGTRQLYYDISGTGALAQLYEWIE